ncbi:MAG TPA: type II CAAX endopeptidase family protein [Anaeromyxobacteraceae bacterium]|nr:type II CAAX endopeptidase family protein [Anaeromyxobacteraceae bacterium]
MDEPSSEPGLPPRGGLPAPPPPPRKSALAFFGLVLVLYASLGILAQASSRLIGFCWSETFTLLVPALVATRGANLKPARALGLSRWPSPAALGLALLAGVAGSLAGDALMALETLLLPARWVSNFDLSRLFETGSPISRVGLALGAVLLAPFCEEVAFRGFVLNSLRSRHPARIAILGSAVLFSIMHLDPVRFVALLGLGVLYGWLAWRSGSVWPSMLAHAVNNALGVALLTTGPPPARAPGGSDWGEAVTPAIVLAVSACALYPLLLAYRRKTPTPPPASDAFVRVHPADLSTDFKTERVPPSLLASILVGVVLFGLLLGHRL